MAWAPTIGVPAREASRTWTLRAASWIGLALVWAIAAGLTESRLLPSPLRVAEVLVDHVASGVLPYHLGITLARVGISFALAMLLGTALGMLMGRSRRLDAFFDGWLVLGLNVPALVVIILCYVWFGLNEFAAILAVTINKVPTVAVTLREGARAIDRELLQVARAFRLPWQRTFWQVYLPQLTPYLLAAARNGLALIWKIVLVVELLGRSSGMGFQLSVFFQFFDITALLAYTLAFVAVVMALELLVLRPLERRAGAWRI